MCYPWSRKDFRNQAIYKVVRQKIFKVKTYMYIPDYTTRFLFFSGQIVILIKNYVDSKQHDHSEYINDGGLTEKGAKKTMEWISQ